jgi:hypothetical protein
MLVRVRYWFCPISNAKLAHLFKIQITDMLVQYQLSNSDIDFEKAQPLMKTYKSASC